MSSLNRIIFYHDPIRLGRQNSHHSELRDYVRDLIKNNKSLKFTEGKYLEVSSKQIQKIGQFPNAFLIACITFRNLISVFRIARRSRVEVFCPNEDTISSLIFLFARRILYAKFNLNLHFLCLKDRFLLRNTVKSRIYMWMLSKYILPSDKLSAETILYADFLKSISNFEVDYLPYPPIDDFKSVENNREKYVNVAVLGSPRKDKGFEFLPNEIRKIRECIPESRFIIQISGINAHEFDRTLSELMDIENLKFIDYFPNKLQISNILASSKFVLLPYDSEIYRYRGSAFAFRALYSGCAIFSYPNTSISDTAFLQKAFINLNNIDLSNLNFAEIVRNGNRMKEESANLWKEAFN